MKTAKKYSSCLRSGLWFSCFMFISTVVLSNVDSTRVYDINDPENPDCPCHQYQQLADEEYARALKNQAGEQKIVADTKTVHLKVKRKRQRTFLRKSFHPAKRADKCFDWN